MIARVAVGAFALVHACAPPPRVVSVPIIVIDVEEIAEPPRAVDRTLHGDTRFVWEERYLVEAACRELRRVSRGRIRLLVLWDLDEDTIDELAAEPRIVRTPRYLAPEHCGGHANGGEIRLVVDNCPELYPCALHELGHFVGLEHAPAGAVMRAKNPAWDFNEGDRAECARVGLCERRGI